jgi:hypothetical protein
MKKPWLIHTQLPAVQQKAVNILSRRNIASRLREKEETRRQEEIKVEEVYTVGEGEREGGRTHNFQADVSQVVMVTMLLRSSAFNYISGR